MYGILKDFGLPTYLAGIIILVSLAYKRIKEHQAKNLSSSKEQLEAIVALLSDKEKMTNKFLIEQVFNYKFREYIPYRVIMILLEFENPTEGIKQWILGKNHLTTDLNTNRIGFYGRMVSESYRNTWRYIGVIGYFLFSFAGLGLLLSLPKIFVAVHYAWVIGSGVLVLYLLWVAYEFMTSALKIKAAESIIKEFHRYEKLNNVLNKDAPVDAQTYVETQNTESGNIMNEFLSNIWLLVTIAILAVTISILASCMTCKWHWFGRSGAILTMSGVLLSIRPLVRMGLKEWIRSLSTINGGNFLATTAEIKDEMQSKQDAVAFQLGAVMILLGTLIWAYGDLIGGFP